MLIACVVCEVGHEIRNIIECKGKGIIHQAINGVTSNALVKLPKFVKVLEESF
jgi:hypothetical protein